MDKNLQIKHDLYHEGVNLIIPFAGINGIPLPKIEDDPDLDSYGLYQNPWFNGDKRIRHPRIRVNVAKSRLPVQKPHGACWSFPKYKIDRTAMGIVAHEFGHHTEDCFRLAGKWPAVMWRAIYSKYPKERISGYEPNPAEAFAETMRLFILNPHLLAGGAPTRYRFITETLGLLQTEKRGAHVVVGNKNYVDQILKWTRRPK